MRYISAPHRSQTVAGSRAGVEASADFTTVMVTGWFPRTVTVCGGASRSSRREAEPDMGPNYVMD
jgi:hypothetical protein